MTITGTTRLLPTLLAGAFAVVASGAFAQSMKFDKPDPDRAYSPYPEQAFPNRVLFGDTHSTPPVRPTALASFERLGARPDAVYAARMLKG